MSKTIDEVKKEIGEEIYQRIVEEIGEAQAKASLLGPISEINRKSIKEKGVDEWVSEYKKSLKYSGIIVFVIGAIVLFGLLYWIFVSDDDANVNQPTANEQTTQTTQEQSKPPEEPKPKQEENSAYTTCMAQTEYLKGADKERLIKACEKNKGQDASLEKNQEYAKKKKGDIVIGCRKGIREQLKQPSSADFRELDYYTSYESIIYKTEVISKNDFNAEVRNIVTCTLAIKDGVPGEFSAKLDQ